MRQRPQLAHAGRQARGLAPQPGGEGSSNEGFGGFLQVHGPSAPPAPPPSVPPPQLLASASYDDTVKLYREEEDDWVCCATLEGHESTVWSLAFDRSGERLASCSDDKTVRIWQQYKPGNEEGERLSAP